MNCGNCNNPLTPGNNVCPTCGALNMPLPNVGEVNNQGTPVAEVHTPEQPVEQVPTQEPTPNESLVQDNPSTELEHHEEPNTPITADMAPPTLNIEEDNLTAGVTDISNANISTYAPEELANQQEAIEEAEEREEERVAIAIPEVKAPVINENVPVDENGVPIVENNGEIKPTEVVAETNKKKNMLKLPKTIKIGNKDIKIPDMKSGKQISVSLATIGLVVVFIIGLVVGQMFFSKSVYVPTTVNTRTETDITQVADGKNNITKAGAYTYKIPEAYNYDRRDGGVAVLDKKDDFRLFLRAVPGSYEDLASARVSVMETVKEQGVTVVSYKETLVEKKNYVVIESTIGMTNRLLAFTDAGNDYVFYIEIVNYNNTYDYNVLDLADDIIRNAVYDQDESDIELIPTKDISEIVIKASQEYKQLTN